MRDLFSFTSRLLPIFDLIALLDQKNVSKVKLSESDHQQFIELQLCDLVSTMAVNPLLRLVIEKIEQANNSPEVQRTLQEIQSCIFSNQELSNFFGLSYLKKASLEKDINIRMQLLQAGCDALKKDILRVDLHIVAPLLLRSNASTAAIKLCVHKAL